MRPFNCFSFLSVASATIACCAEIEERRSGIFGGEMIAAHNFFRGQHGADPLTWRGDLAQEAQGWANTCNWFHDSVGENLASSTGFTSWGAFVNMWGSERKKYDWNAASFSVHTGHFTQVVWKNSRSVGCGWKKCGGGQDKAKGFYVVCKYDPTGNYQGQFRQNVGKQITGQLSDEWQPRGSNQVGTHNEENGSLERL
ncbi:Protein PRY1 [Metarhizium anisopliae]|nr:Protein PRY1 [Metarhizium anisopliae]KAF5120983.1 Protein PRY1 [Metarhizium anisopliae]KAF5121034.1 Protein PRY1 [Metarhizium anisopliae]